jgi:cell division inhibitor SepF
MPRFVEKFKDMWNPPDDEYDYEDEVGEEEQMQDERQNYEPDQARRDNARRVQAAGQDNKVVNIHATAQLQVVLFKPERFGEETCTIADELLKMHTVVLNLENTEKDISRRIVDFLSGVAYANGGKIKKVATSTFIITPYNVDLTGDDVLDELESNGVYF